MGLRYHKATLKDLDLLVHTRVQVLLAANGLPEETDMTAVETASRDYYHAALADGSHAASVTIDGQAITAFSLHCRSYTLSDTPALLLPIRQAAAIAAERYLNAELRVCYDDRGADAVGVSWFGF